MSAGLSLLDLLAPFIGAIVLIVLAVLAKSKGESVELQFPIPFIGHLQKRVDSIYLRRGIILFGALLCLIAPGVRNYDGFFPKRLQIETFFDDAGIEQSLKQFPADVQTSFKLAPDWHERKVRYFQLLNQALEENGAGGFQFQLDASAVHSAGETDIEVHRIHGWRERYQFTRIHGSLSHSMDRPGSEPARIRSEFDLIPNGDSIVELPFVSAYFGRPIVIRPQFKQLMWVSASKEIYHHNLIAVTRIDLLPLIDVGNSVYLWVDTDGRRVPIGYAVYLDN